MSSTRILSCLVLGLLNFSLFSFESKAELLQIIHTNDLHGFFDQAKEPGTGGYEAVRRVIEELRSRAQAEGIETLVLDAGDFMEGYVYYMSDEGIHPLKAMNQMGFDAVAIGNHDWLMSLPQLDRLLKFAPPPMPLLSANMYFDRGYRKYANKYIRPHATFNKAGSKIAVVGLSTNEVFYNWAMEEGFLFDPIWDARNWERQYGNQYDHVIALTHLGHSKDKKLVSKTSDIGLVVGGHSHSTLREPTYIKNLNKREIPIVQAGAHGTYVGNLRVDLQPKGKIKVISYELVPVIQGDEQHPVLHEVIAQAQEGLSKRFTNGWLDENVGYSNIDLNVSSDYTTPWAQFMVDSFRKTLKTDIALDVPEFAGPPQLPGPLTNFSMLKLYPHMFNVNAKYGWTLWQTRTLGLTLWAVLNIAVNRGYHLHISGLTYKVKKLRTGKKLVHGVKVRGKRLRLLKIYSMALPEGFGRGALGVTELVRLIFYKLKDSKVPIVTALSKNVAAAGMIGESPKN